MVLRACNLSTQEAEVGGYLRPGVGDQPAWQHSENLCKKGRQHTPQFKLLLKG